MQDFRNLSVWVKAHKMALDVYVVSAVLVTRREFSLRNQMVRAAVSVPANIAEGCGRSGGRELRRFCRIASGSGSELEYHLLLARDLGFLPASEYERLATQVVEVKRMLSGFIRTLDAIAERERRTDC
jgi:four helix bundle protein